MVLQYTMFFSDFSFFFTKSDTVSYDKELIQHLDYTLEI